MFRLTNSTKYVDEAPDLTGLKAMLRGEMIKTTGQVQIARNSLSQISDGVYRFSITMSGFIVNGFVYNAKTGQIRMPSCNYGSGSKKLVRAYGIHVKRLRERIERELADGNND